MLGGVFIFLIIPFCLLILYHDYEDLRPDGHQVGRAREHLDKLTGFHFEHRNYRAILRARRQYIEQQLRSYDELEVRVDQLDLWLPRSFRGRPVVSQHIDFVAGRTTNLSRGCSSPTPLPLVVAAHFDTAVGVPGTADNLAAVAVSLAAAELLMMQQQVITDATSEPASCSPEVIFLFGAAEELGLLGAEAFAQSHVWREMVRNSAGIINFDAGGGDGPPFLVRSTASPAVLSSLPNAGVYLFASSMGQDLQDAGLVRSNTDFAVWQLRGFPAIDVALLTAGHVYHSAFDDGRAGPSNRTLQMELDLVLNSHHALSNEHRHSSDSNGRVASFFAIGGRLWLLSSAQARLLGALALCLAFWSRQQSSIWRWFLSVAVSFWVILVTIVFTFLVSGYVLPPYWAMQWPAASAASLTFFCCFCVWSLALYFGHDNREAWAAGTPGLLAIGAALATVPNLRCGPLLAVISIAGSLSDLMAGRHLAPLQLAVLVVPTTLFMEHVIMLARFFGPLAGWMVSPRFIQVFFGAACALFVTPAAILATRVMIPVAAVEEFPNGIRRRFLVSRSGLVLTVLALSTVSWLALPPWSSLSPRRVLVQHHPDLGVVIANALDGLPLPGIEGLRDRDHHLRWHPTQRPPPTHAALVLKRGKHALPAGVQGTFETLDDDDDASVKLLSRASLTMRVQFPNAIGVQLTVSPCTESETAGSSFLLVDNNDNNNKPRIFPFPSDGSCQLELLSPGADGGNQDGWVVGVISPSGSPVRAVQALVFHDECPMCQTEIFDQYHFENLSILSATVYNVTLEI